MNELIETLKEKVGLSAEQGEGAVGVVMEWIKEKLPAGLGDQVQGLLDSGGDGASGLADKAKGALGGLLGGND